MKKLRVFLAQLSTKLGDVKGNEEKILEALEAAKREKVNLLVTPELSTLGYGSGDIYLDKVNENLESLERIKERVDDLYSIIGYVEKDNYGFFYNSACLINKKSIIGNYRKVQLVNYRLFDEKRYFKRGAKLPVFDIGDIKIGILICEDVWFPEPSRAMALRGADLIVVLGASPFERFKKEVWENFLIQRARDNILPFVFCNQAGCQDGVNYLGYSMYVSAAGKIVKTGKLLEEDYVVVEVDLEESRRLRRRDTRLRELRREILEELLRAYDEMEDDRA
ncbi:MAG: nitrilase-related carbon-nitrogen hydrolase [Candidatus Hydrothermales bacterium]